MEKIKITDMSPHNNTLYFVSRLKNTARPFQVANRSQTRENNFKERYSGIDKRIKNLYNLIACKGKLQNTRESIKFWKDYEEK